MTSGGRSRFRGALTLALCGCAWLLVRCNPSVQTLTTGDATTDAGGNDAPSNDVSSDAPSSDVSSDAPSNDVSSDAPSNDVSSDAPATDGGNTDAPSDAPATDGGSTDAPSDAPADAGDGAITGYCASLSPTPSLCADFDTGSFDRLFSYDETTGTGSISGDSTASVSAPNSFLAKLGVSPTNNDYAYMTRDFVGTGTQVTYSFDLRLEAWAGGQNSGELADIVINDGAAQPHALTFYVTETYAAVEEGFASTDGGMTYKDHALTWVPQLDTWTRISFSIDVNAKSCSASVNGKDVLATNSTLDSSWAAGTPSVDLGLTWVDSQSGAWAARYDNVVVTWK